MEIEPEIINPAGRGGPPPGKLPGKVPLIVFGGLALVIGAALLFFMFWVALFFAALGLLAMGINFIRSWFRGGKPEENSRTRVQFYIGRGPPGP